MGLAVRPKDFDAPAATAEYLCVSLLTKVDEQRRNRAMGVALIELVCAYAEIDQLKLATSYCV